MHSIIYLQDQKIACERIKSSTTSLDRAQIQEPLRATLLPVVLPLQLGCGIEVAVTILVNFRQLGLHVVLIRT